MRSHRCSTGSAAVVLALGLAAAGCGSAAASDSTTAHSTTTTIETTTTTTTTTTVPPSTTTTSTTLAQAGTALPAGQPLAGKVVGIDPGHNGDNYTNPAFLDKQVFNGRTDEDCDTTGTETDAGYTEAQYNFNVAEFLTADLQQEGAKVVLTRTSNGGVGPCVDQRAQILNAAGANVAIDIHADGGLVDGRGFAILEPVADGPNSGIIAASGAFGAIVQQRFQSVTGMPISTYDGANGISYRSDLAGLNLATEPKVLIECGNMRNATDAAMLASTPFQQGAALALALAITDYLH